MRVHIAPDARVAALAARQWGVVSFEQLRACGLTQPAIARRVAAGRLHRLHHGVYAVGHPALAKDGRLLAAALACGPGAVLSHRTAGAIWDLRPSEAVEVTVPTHAGRAPRPGIRIHRIAGLAPDDVTVRDGLPVTDAARTLLDLATVLTPQALDRALVQAEVLRLDVHARLTTLLGEQFGRRGAPALAAALDRVHEATALTRSELETKLLTLCDDHGLPRPESGAHIAGFELDFLWRAQRLVVETDGFTHHGTREAFERDRVRDAELTRRGLRVVRLTHRRIVRAPGEVAALLRDLLG